MDPIAIPVNVERDSLDCHPYLEMVYLYHNRYVPLFVRLRHHHQAQMDVSVIPGSLASIGFYPQL